MRPQRYEYLVEHRGRRPVSLWRRTARTWQYWSLVRWDWTDLTHPVPEPPRRDRLSVVTEAEATAMLTDRQRWVRYWAVYRRRELGGPDHPTTVIRRRDSPEAACDEVFGLHQAWLWTDLLVRAQTGRGSSLPALQPIHQREADRILHHNCGPTGATTWWEQRTHAPGTPGWHGTGRDTGRHLPAADQTRAAAEHGHAHRIHPEIDAALAELLHRLNPRHRAVQAAPDTLKPWPSYRRNVASAWESGEPIDEAIIQTDLHRYCLTWPRPCYPDGVRDAIQHLEHLGFQPVPGTHLDLWEHPTARGVTTVWRHTPTGRLVEILFHTVDTCQGMLAGDAPYEVLRCRYLDHGQLAVTPAHRDVARGLLALAYHQAHTHTLVVEPDAPTRAGLSRLFPARQGRPHREDHPG